MTKTINNFGHRIYTGEGQGKVVPHSIKSFWAWSWARLLAVRPQVT